jgi:hypothetical protein
MVEDISSLLKILSDEELLFLKNIMTNETVIDPEFIAQINSTIVNAISKEYNYTIGSLKLPKLYVAFVIIAILSPLSSKLLDIVKIFLKKIASLASGCFRKKKGITKEQLDIMCESRNREHV